MSTQKVSVTLDELAIARARALVGPRGLSAYLDRALRDKLEQDERNRAFDEYLAELEEEDPSSPEEIQRGREMAEAIMVEVARAKTYVGSDGADRPSDRRAG